MLWRCSHWTTLLAKDTKLSDMAFGLSKRLPSRGGHPLLSPRYVTSNTSVASGGISGGEPLLP